MESRNQNYDRRRATEFLLFVTDALLLILDYMDAYTRNLIRRLDAVFRNFFESTYIAELADIIDDKLTEYPILKFAAVAAALTCAIPVMMFVVFGILTVMVTFVGFLFIEGTLLAVGGLCMFICLISIITFMSLMGVALGIFYLLATKFVIFLSKFQSTSNILRSIAPSLVDTGAFEVSNSIADSHQD